MTPGSWDEMVERRSAEVKQGQETVAHLLHELSRRLRSSPKLLGAAQYLQEHSVRDLADGAERLARRYPVQALLAGVAAGFFVGRALRSR